MHYLYHIDAVNVSNVKKKPVTAESMSDRFLFYNFAVKQEEKEFKH
ncbi:hypothetical protein B4100_0038 [Heyndrickxia coagulans]|nr:hypothetical protein B4100_0038 [Heyndrickxia coagulans]